MKRTTREGEGEDEDEEDEDELQTFDLEAKCELRFEVAEDQQVTLTLNSGNAELFGAPLVLKKPYKMSPGGNFAVFTWYSAQLTLEGKCENAYTSDDTPMETLVNVHTSLEIEREKAVQSSVNNFGPRVVVAGPANSGKSAISSILASYAARKNRRCMMLDLDVALNHIAHTAPGTIAASTIDPKSLCVEEGRPVGGAALCYFFGDTVVKDRPKLYKKQVSQMMRAVEKRFEQDTVAKASGIIVNTGGWVDGIGYDILKHVIKEVKADAVLVVGDDRLLNNLKRDVALSAEVYRNSTTPNSRPVNAEGIKEWHGARKVMKLPRPAGVVIQEEDKKQVERKLVIKQYFFGSPATGDLSPSILEVSFDEITIMHTRNEAAQSDEAIRPVGMSSLLDSIFMEKVEPSSTLQYSLLAVSAAQDEESVSETNVLGFVHVKLVNMQEEKMTVSWQTAIFTGLDAKVTNN